MRHASRHNTAKYSALVRHEFCWAVESITCMSPHALPCAADAVVVYETLPLEDEQVSRIGISRPHDAIRITVSDDFVPLAYNGQGVRQTPLQQLSRLPQGWGEIKN